MVNTPISSLKFYGTATVGGDPFDVEIDISEYYFPSDGTSTYAPKTVQKIGSTSYVSYARVNLEEIVFSK